MNIKALIGMADVLPGMKTYITAAFAVGMIICQTIGYHVFSAEDWALVGVTGGVFMKMGMDRNTNPLAKSKPKKK